MSATPERRAESIFYGAFELLRSEWDGFLNEACGQDAALRAEVEELLRMHDGAAGFLPDDAPASPELETQFVRMKPEAVGERIGNYKLLEQIGEGGFGVVWVAEQEKPVRRRVALKIIKLGMDTKEVIARFEQERQALAMMDHPNIAKVLDASATALGRPYFVMELVRGIKITQYCDQANLPTGERLRLFIAVCHAVQHAHQKGIIHRDLKPSNILVTLHDGVPVPKVIDFGVAKAIQQQRLTDLTIYTQFEQMVGTPLYMSPEQAEMSGLDIDTRSDIYSLGVLLYELLAGRTPFDPETLMKRGLDEIRRAVREQEPQKPSTFVSTMAVDMRTNLAQHRQTDSAKLIGQIRGDLDWIVMKALEKDRARRYETANGLALDIQRHLQSEPVQARPASQFYRFRRFARRNKAAVAATATVALALLAGAIISTWQALRATHAERESSENARVARTEAAKSEQVAQFLKDMLGGIRPGVALGRDTKLLREILDKTAERVDKDLNAQPEVEAELRGTIGLVYDALGEYEKAAAMHSEALAIRRKLFGNEHPKVATALHNLADVLEAQGKPAEAETMHREALAMRRKLLGDEHDHVAMSLEALSWDLFHQNKLDEAETLAREALAINKKLFGNESNDVAGTLHNLSHVLQSQGKLSEAEAILRKALEIRRKLSGTGNQNLTTSLHSLANLLRLQDKRPEAEAIYREVLRIDRKRFNNEHPRIAGTLHNLAMVLYEQGKLDEAESLFREALATYKKFFAAEHPNVIMALSNLANLFSDQNRLAEAEALFREMLDSARKSATRDVPGLELLLFDLAQILSHQGKYADAELLLREFLNSRQARLAAGHGDLLSAFEGVARLLSDWVWAECGSKPRIQSPGSEVTARAREAERLMRESLAVRLRGGNSNHWRTGDARSRLGAALVAVAVADPALTEEGRVAILAEAEPCLLEGSEALLASDEAKNGKGREALERILRLYEAWEKPDKLAEWQQKLTDFDKATALVKQAKYMRYQQKPGEAEPLYRDALALWRKVLGNEHPAVATSLTTLGNMFRDQDKLPEAERCYREAVTITRKSADGDPPGLDDRMNRLAEALYRQGKYAEADPLYREAMEIAQAVHGRESKSLTASFARLLTDWALAERGALSDVQNLDSKIAERAREAERILRARLGATEDRYWQTAEIRSRLGGAVLAVAATDPALSGEARLAKFTEAEALLLESSEAMQLLETPDRRYKREALTRLVRLYEAWEKPAKASEWRKKVEEFDKTQAKPEAGRAATEPGP